jgi:hypothetical protein
MVKIMQMVKGKSVKYHILPRPHLGDCIVIDNEGVQQKEFSGTFLEALQVMYWLNRPPPYEVVFYSQHEPGHQWDVIDGNGNSLNIYFNTASFKKERIKYNTQEIAENDAKNFFEGYNNFDFKSGKDLCKK